MNGLPSSTVLLVDDYEAGRYATGRTLRAAGFAVVEAGTGEEALHLAGQGPDLVLLDVNLPDMSGFEVCSRLKSDPATRHLPVVHLSATYVGSDHVVEGLETGADGYLTQPVNPRQLVATIKAVLRLYAAEHELRQQGDLLDAVVRSSQDAIYVQDLEGSYLYINAAARAIVGDDAAVGGSDTAAAQRGRASLQKERDRQVVASREPVTFEERISAPDGAERIFLIVKGPLLDDGGEPYAIYGVAHDITDRKQAEEEIRQVNAELESRVAERTEELEEANRELEAFAYSVSHDLRAPLRAISGFSQLLAEDHATDLDEAAQTDLERIRSATARMSRLIDDLLQLSRMSRSELRMEEVDLSAIARAVAKELRESEPDRLMDVVVADGLTAHGDPDLLRVVLDNLLSNAAKFTSHHSSAHIVVGREETPRGPAFFVHDDGAGFDMAYADQLFGAFQRLHRDSDFPGTGVGLATVKRIVRRHRGHVWAEGHVERGATVWFTLPEKPE